MLYPSLAAPLHVSPVNSKTGMGGRLKDVVHILKVMRHSEQYMASGFHHWEHLRAGLHAWSRTPITRHPNVTNNTIMQEVSGIKCHSVGHWDSSMGKSARSEFGRREQLQSDLLAPTCLPWQGGSHILCPPQFIFSTKEKSLWGSRSYFQAQSYNDNVILSFIWQLVMKRGCCKIAQVALHESKGRGGYSLTL